MCLSFLTSYLPPSLVSISDANIKMYNFYDVFLTKIIMSTTFIRNIILQIVPSTSYEWKYQSGSFVLGTNNFLKSLALNLHVSNTNANTWLSIHKFLNNCVCYKCETWQIKKVNIRKILTKHLKHFELKLGIVNDTRSAYHFPNLEQCRKNTEIPKAVDETANYMH